MAARNRYMDGELDIWPSETDMWLENQIYDLRNRHVAGESNIGPQICGWRVRYRASETNVWLES
jgi:hypothetical protein